MQIDLPHIDLTYRPHPLHSLFRSNHRLQDPILLHNRAKHMLLGNPIRTETPSNTGTCAYNDFCNDRTDLAIFPRCDDALNEDKQKCEMGKYQSALAPTFWLCSSRAVRIRGI